MNFVKKECTDETFGDIGVRNEVNTHCTKITFVYTVFNTQENRSYTEQQTGMRWKNDSKTIKMCCPKK